MGLTRRDVLKAGLAGAVGALAGCNVSDIAKRVQRDFLEAAGLSDSDKKPSYAPISQANNAAVLEKVYNHFDPSLQPYLKTVPILKTFVGAPKGVIAYANRGAFPYIGVRSDWDNPDFHEGKKDPVLTHELLHIIQDHNKIDAAKFFEAFKRWYLDETYGPAKSAGGVDKGRFYGRGNDMKSAMFSDLYEDTEWDGIGVDDEDRRDMAYMEKYRVLNPTPGVEEFAYLGQSIVPYDFDPNSRWAFVATDRMLELSDELFGYYNGVLNPEILALRGDSIWKSK